MIRRVSVVFSLCMYRISVGTEKVKTNICTNTQCDGTVDEVCGIRQEGEGFRLRLFSSECELLKYGCQVEATLAYRATTLEFCKNAFKTELNSDTSNNISKDACVEYDCSYPGDNTKVCGIKQDREGFRVRIFENKCRLWKYNCDNQVEFNITDLHICQGMELVDKSKATRVDKISNDLIENTENRVVTDNLTRNTNINNLGDKLDQLDDKANNMKNIVVVQTPMMNSNNINETIRDFFAATHVFDLPMMEVELGFLNETTRKRLMKVAGPIKVYQPWVVIPKNVKDDYDHRPTLSSCYHKCPEKCPNTYAPVCGMPGTVAREPSLMFQNHCLMDVAQCKMYRENLSSTALSSYYIESSFLFCLGDTMNGMFRFLPLVRTLQHMGRLKKRGRFRYKFRNMRFFNNLLTREPNLMG